METTKSNSCVSRNKLYSFTSLVFQIKIYTFVSIRVAESEPKSGTLEILLE